MTHLDSIRLLVLFALPVLVASAGGLAHAAPKTRPSSSLSETSTNSPSLSSQTELAELLRRLETEAPSDPAMESAREDIENSEEANSLNAKGLKPWLLER